MVECSPATRAARVRFPADALWPDCCEFKGSMLPCIGHMELLAWMQRAGFSEHIQRFKPHGNTLNSSHFDAPNTKFAPTGYRTRPQHHFTALQTRIVSKSIDNTESSTNQVSTKQLVNAISSPEQTQLSDVRQIHYHSMYQHAAFACLLLMLVR